jgi:hypothetical protein
MVIEIQWWLWRSLIRERESVRWKRWCKKIKMKENKSEKKIQNYFNNIIIKFFLWVVMFFIDLIDINNDDPYFLTKK